MALLEALQSLQPQGQAGFEGLIKLLIERLTGYTFHLSRSADQDGRDMRSSSQRQAVIVGECKRYPLSPLRFLSKGFIRSFGISLSQA
jgi:hypothetical protein